MTKTNMKQTKELALAFGIVFSMGVAAALGMWTISLIVPSEVFCQEVEIDQDIFKVTTVKCPE